MVDWIFGKRLDARAPGSGQLCLLSWYAPLPLWTDTARRFICIQFQCLQPFECIQQHSIQFLSRFQSSQLALLYRSIFINRNIAGFSSLTCCDWTRTARQRDAKEEDEEKINTLIWFSRRRSLVNRRWRCFISFDLMSSPSLCFVFRTVTT